MKYYCIYYYYNINNTHVDLPQKKQATKVEHPPLQPPKKIPSANVNKIVNKMIKVSELDVFILKCFFRLSAKRGEKDPFHQRE